MRLRPMSTLRLLLRTLLALLATVLLAVVALLPGAPPAAASPEPGPGLPDPAQKIHASMLSEMDNAAAGELVEALVVLGARPELGGLRQQPRPVTAALRRTAAATQAPLAKRVRAHGGAVRASFWLQNMLLVEALPATLAALAESPQVVRVIPNLEVRLPEPEAGGEALQQADVTWGIEKIRADQVHQQGITGAGVRVAVLDTGVDITHPDLAGKMVTDDPADPAHPGGWVEFAPDGDPVAGSTPDDSASHGTHVSGTVLGGDASGTQIGVAPGAQLMAAMVIPGGSGTLTQVIAGMQWAAAPTDGQGNPAGSPADVVNMSLGGCGLSQEMVIPTQNLLAAGILPAFAIGNDDPFGCPSCGVFDSASPGNIYRAIGVGATGINDDVAEFSCGGVIEKADWPDPPADWPATYVKPDVSAPGVDVESAVPGGGYQTLSGTSMATPHVAGALALMREARTDIDASAALAGTSFFDDRHGPERPNPRFGWGRIDALDAVAEAALTSGIIGVVTDITTNLPIAGARVTNVTTGRWVDTGPDGSYEMRLPAGVYQLEFTSFGYQTSTVPGAPVLEDVFTAVNQELVPAPTGSIGGTVAYGPTGITVPGATVRVLDVPADLAAESGGAGDYLISGVPVGTYEVQASAPDGSRSGPVQVTVTNGGTANAYLPLQPPANRPVSVAFDGSAPNSWSQFASISADGRLVAFSSFATNLVEGDVDDGFLDGYVHDRLTGITEKTSLAPDGSGADSDSGPPLLSAGGVVVGFNSSAANLVPGDTNGEIDVFVRDRTTGVTERVTATAGGGEADGGSVLEAMSVDGRYLVFQSTATNLLPGGDSNGWADVYLHDRVTGATELISAAHDGSLGDGISRRGSISDDGRYVAFSSDATNLVPGDTNGDENVFIRDRVAGTIELVEGPSGGPTSAPVLSSDGQLMAYDARPTQFGVSEIYVEDRQSGVIELISATPAGDPGGFGSFAPRLSADGNLVAFYSSVTNLVAGDTNGVNDVFLRDRQAGVTQRVSLGAGGAEADGQSVLPALTPDGRYLVFDSEASNLGLAPAPAQYHVYIRDLQPATPTPRFAVWDLAVSPPMAAPGQQVTVQAQVRNYGNASGEYEAVLRVDGEVVDSQAVLLSPGGTAQVQFSTSSTEPGEHRVQIGPVTAVFDVS